MFIHLLIIIIIFNIFPFQYKYGNDFDLKCLALVISYLIVYPSTTHKKATNNKKSQGFFIKA